MARVLAVAGSAFVEAQEAGASHNFPDVPPDSFYHDFVQFLVENGITSGCGGGQFCGEDSVTRGQMAVFLKKLSDLVDQRVQATLATVLGATPCMRREGNDVIFEGCNVHIRSGAGSTDPVNGLGNLIVGYNEPSPPGSPGGEDVRTGSHNLVVGPFHTYSATGGLVAGRNNAVTGNGASVTGGEANTASGFAASVGGGEFNTAGGAQATVSGGAGRGAPSDDDWAAGNVVLDN